MKDDGEGTISRRRTRGAMRQGGGDWTADRRGCGHDWRGCGRASDRGAAIGGLGAGLATVGLVTLFTRRRRRRYPVGTQVEMVLQRPLMLEEENLEAAGAHGAATSFVPSAHQPKPIEKPQEYKCLCPPGGLGCK